MEETTTSWKNHSFTLLVFGGIVVLCSIFFVLGMLVGRNQGQRVAEQAFAEKAKNKPVAVAGADGLQLNYYPEATDEKDRRLQPAPEPPPAEPAMSATPAASGGASSSARLDVPSQKSQAPAKPSAATKATVKPTVAKPPAPASKDRYVQLLATKNQKQAKEELKKVQSKDFKALIMDVTLKNERWHRVMVGPYKESELNLALSDLKAKGYKNAIVQR